MDFYRAKMPQILPTTEMVYETSCDPFSNLTTFWASVSKGNILLNRKPKMLLHFTFGLIHVYPRYQLLFCNVCLKPQPGYTFFARLKNTKFITCT